MRCADDAITFNYRAGSLEQLGHTDPKFTLRVYAHAMRFSEEDRALLTVFVEGGVLGVSCTRCG